MTKDQVWLSLSSSLFCIPTEIPWPLQHRNDDIDISPLVQHRTMFHPMRADPDEIAPRDLSNLKLAQNQTELSRQIAELRSTVEAQGQIMKRLLEAVEATSKGKQREIDPNSWFDSLGCFLFDMELSCVANVQGLGCGYLCFSGSDTTHLRNLCSVDPQPLPGFRAVLMDHPSSFCGAALATLATLDLLTVLIYPLFFRLHACCYAGHDLASKTSSRAVSPI